MIQSQKTSGFAIGAILLAVVLIAAIVAAISAGSSGSSSVSEREKDRLQASALVSQAIELGQTIALIRSQSGLPIEAITNSTNCSGGAGACYPLFSPSEGMTEPKVSSQALTTSTAAPLDSNKGEWLYRDDVRVETQGGTDVGTSSNDVAIFVKGIDDSVCRQINNVVNDFAISDTQIGNSSSFDPEATATLVFSSHSTFYPMGCSFDSSGSPHNFFYSVLVVN